MISVIVDLSVIKYAPVQSLENISQMLISWSGEIHTLEKWEWSKECKSEPLFWYQLLEWYK